MAPPNSAAAIRVSGDLTTTGVTPATGIVASTVGKASTGGVQILGTFSATLQFEQSLDGGVTWIAKTVYPAAGGGGVTSATSTGQWKFTAGGMSNFRVRCSAYTSGTASVTLVLTEGDDFSFAPVARAGLKYKTVAASQTDQFLGATGATGDYLSHIVIQPATTGAGTVTVKDGTTVIFTFTTGTLSDLSPKTVPFGAFSVNGAWKVTTGANVAVIGFGDFT